MADSNVFGLTEKTDPVDGDWLYIVDVETDPDSDKKVSGANSRKWVIATAGSENQVATFDANGKLVGTALITSTASAVTIGNAAGATVAIGHASGVVLTSGLHTYHGTVAGTATFNGALLSPGTGTNSFKAGPGASVNTGGGIAIGNGATANSGGNGLCIAIGQNASTGAAYCIAIGANASTGGQAYNIAIGTGAKCVGSYSGRIVIGSDATSTGGANAIAIGRNVSANHAGAVSIGRDSSNNSAASSANNDFTLGVAAHNYKFPGTIITDLRFRTTTGTKIGTGTDQLIGFWNATPVDQPGNLPAAGADLGEVQTLVNGIRSLLIEIGLMAPNP